MTLCEGRIIGFQGSVPTINISPVGAGRARYFSFLSPRNLDLVMPTPYYTETEAPSISAAHGIPLIYLQASHRASCRRGCTRPYLLSLSCRLATGQPSCVSPQHGPHRRSTLCLQSTQHRFNKSPVSPAEVWTHDTLAIVRRDLGLERDARLAHKPKRDLLIFPTPRSLVGAWPACWTTRNGGAAISTAAMLGCATCGQPQRRKVMRRRDRRDTQRVS